jgi:hypothetical protein
VPNWRKWRKFLFMWCHRLHHHHLGLTPPMVVVDPSFGALENRVQQILDPLATA